MPDSTLNAFFGVSVKGFWDDIFARLGEAEAMAGLREKVFAQLTTKHWPNVVSGLADKAKDLFDVDIGWLLVNGWNKYEEIREYGDPEKYPPNETKLVPLGKHSMNIGYSPYLEVMFNDQPIAKIVFDASLTFDLEGFVLTIRNGKITKVHTGSCEGKGMLEFKKHLLVERALAKVTLPGAIDLGEGIDLRAKGNV